MARIKFAPVVIPQISSWVDAGFSTREIAEKIGCTLGTLRVRCSQLGISLRHDGRDKHTYTTNVGDRPQASERQARGEAMQAIKILEGRENLLVLPTSGFAVDELRQVATARGISSVKIGTRSLGQCQITAHRGKMDDRSVRAFAVKPRAFGAPLCGVGA